MNGINCQMIVLMLVVWIAVSARCHLNIAYLSLIMH